MSDSKPVSATATARLKQDYLRLLKDPVPYVQAAPLPSNILIWYYVVSGPVDTPYYGGLYFGKLVFPREFPFKPPAIYMITPNGRFKVNQKLCLSISDFHPDTWNPAWNVATILTGLLSFMLENTPTSGSTESSDATKKRLAIESIDFNLKDKYFCELFPDLCEELLKKKKEKEENEAKLKQNESNLNLNLSNKTESNNNNNNLIQNQNWFISFFGNLIVMIGVALFAFIVKHVFSTVN